MCAITVNIFPSWIIWFGVVLKTYGLPLCVALKLSFVSDGFHCGWTSVGNDRQNKPTRKPNIHWLFIMAKDKRKTEHTNENTVTRDVKRKKIESIKTKHLRIKWPSTIVAAASQLPSEPFRAHI